MNQDGIKILLPRGGPDDFWETVEEHYAGEDRRKWKYLAMLALRENAGWPLKAIARVFEHRRGHVARCLQQIKRELRSRFRCSPDFLSIDEAAEGEPAEADVERLDWETGGNASAA